MKNINQKIGNTNRKLANFVRKGFPLRWGFLMPLTIGASDLDSSYKILNDLNSNKIIYSEITNLKENYSTQKTINMYDAVLPRIKYSKQNKKVMKGGKN